MNAVNASYAKLLEYEERASGAGAATPEPESARGDFAGVAFRIGDTRLTCSLEKVHEFIPMQSITRVPGTKPFILGLANVRGDLVTVVDLACYLTGNRSNISMRSRLLSATLRGRPVGLLVDEVFGQKYFVTAAASEATVSPKSPLAGLIKRMHRSGSEQWQELDLDILFNSPEFLDGAAA